MLPPGFLEGGIPGGSSSAVAGPSTSGNTSLTFGSYAPDSPLTQRVGGVPAWLIGGGLAVVAVLLWRGK